MKTEHTINIKTNPKFRPWRMLMTVSAQIGVIGVGVLVDSAAMQWAGFVVLSLMLAELAIGADPRGLSIGEARREIDRIEAEEQGQ
ncbi:MAG: hypothetical protein H5U19_14320 [Rhodobacteraceae bacterium]|nr:hypothetical protein [Paracoccaceae bacterium]